MRSLACLLVLLALPAAAPRAPEEGFRALMLVTADPGAFRRAWHGPQPPRLNVTRSARRGVPVEAMIVFANCRAGSDGKCRITGEFTVARPDGTLYRPPVRGTLWTKPPAAAERMLLADGSAGFRLEPREPLGTYRLIARVTDEVAGVTVEAEQAIIALEHE